MTEDRPVPSTVEINPKGEIKTCVIWLHGIGADGHDFEAIVPQLRLPEPSGFRFVFPHAPQRAVTVNGGYVMRAWYDIAEPDLSRRVDEQGIRQSRALVDNLIAREIGMGIEPSRIVVAGFSQGGVIALEAGANHAQPLGGIVALSAYLPLQKSFPQASFELPIFMGHGLMDPVVPLSFGEQARAALQAQGYAVEWSTYPMQHAVCLEEIADISRWLLR